MGDRRNSPIANRDVQDLVEILRGIDHPAASDYERSSSSPISCTRFPMVSRKKNAPRSPTDLRRIVVSLLLQPLVHPHLHRERSAESIGRSAQRRQTRSSKHCPMVRELAENALYMDYQTVRTPPRTGPTARPARCADLIPPSPSSGGVRWLRRPNRGRPREAKNLFRRPLRSDATMPIARRLNSASRSIQPAAAEHLGVPSQVQREALAVLMILMALFSGWVLWSTNDQGRLVGRRSWMLGAPLSDGLHSLLRSCLHSVRTGC